MLTLRRKIIQRLFWSRKAVDYFLIIRKSRIYVHIYYIEKVPNFIVTKKTGTSI